MIQKMLQLGGKQNPTKQKFIQKNCGFDEICKVFLCTKFHWKELHKFYAKELQFGLSMHFIFSTNFIQIKKVVVDEMYTFIFLH
jgi:hypothetical protein